MKRSKLHLSYSPISVNDDAGLEIKRCIIILANIWFFVVPSTMPLKAAIKQYRAYRAYNIGQRLVFAYGRETWIFPKEEVGILVLFERQIDR